MSVKRALIITLFDNVNYGNKLQNYAMQKILEDKGFICETGIYKEKPVFLSKKGVLLSKLPPITQKIKEKKKKHEKFEKIQEFSKKWIKTDKTEYSFYDMSKFDHEKYDYIFVGSDQVWHNWTDTKEELDYFFLKFVPQNKRVCISPSFGFDEFPDEYIMKYKEGLMGFSMLSCREKSGCDLIKSLTGKNATLLIDPTLMLDKNSWDLLIEHPNIDIPEKYAVFYFLSSVPNFEKAIIREECEKKGYMIIDLMDINGRYYCSSPGEFLYYIKNADYIYTDSYHGSIFSIIYKKNFNIYTRKDNGGTKMNSRIYTLFDSLKIDKNVNERNFGTINEKIIENQKIFNDFLDKAIAG